MKWCGSVKSWKLGLRCWGLLSLMGVWLCGCSGAKLDYSKEVQLTLNMPEHVSHFEPQPQPQTLTIEIQSSEPVHAGIYLNSAVAEPRDLSTSARVSQAHWHKKQMQQETATVTIPANTAYTLMVYLSEDSKKPAIPKIRIKN